MKNGLANRQKLAYTIITLVLLSSLSTLTAQAAVVRYTLDNVIQDDNQQMTGSFLWNYTVGDFENGSGVFTELYIPDYGSDISALTITFDVANSIEFSLTANINNQGVDVTLFLLSPLGPTQSADLDLTRSKYAIEVGSRTGNYQSGSITPELAAVPAPAALWLFLSGLTGLFGITKWAGRNRQTTS